jgi:3-hydroxyisobutyrate dehydrogenase
MTELGFIGLGTMGAPIALNLVRAGQPLVVWNRSASSCAPIVAAGAAAAASVDEVFERCELVFLMLADGVALDSVLGRGDAGFSARAAAHVIVNMATVPADYSASLGRAIETAGGTYVEAPVSGSRKPAELGALVAMVAGERQAAERVSVVLGPACRKLVYCGPVPGGLLMKHATNLLLIPSMVALAEAAAYARQAGLPLDAFGEILLSGQMANDLLRAKVPKLLAHDFTPQASVGNVLASANAALAAVESVNGAHGMIGAARQRLVEACDEGLVAQDVLALAGGPGAGANVPRPLQP